MTTGAPAPPCPAPATDGGSSEQAELAATVDRLMALVREQDAQIAALQALIAELL